MTNLYAPVILAPKKKPVQRKCSTCADKRCRVRGSVCNWLHCGEWTPEQTKNKKVEDTP